MPHNDLYDFMQQLQVELASEYGRIQRRVKEDPGIAGAQGEENWAALLRDWLPATYHVVTRGRIIDHRGVSSPEVDVLILHPAYPRHLLNKKHYLVAGVVAAFECKLTLRKQHLSRAFETCAKIKALAPAESGTPYCELHRMPIFGILAHAHSWKGPLAGGAFSLLESLNDKQFDGPQHPSEMLDVVCVANSATYCLTKDIFIGRGMNEPHAVEFLADCNAPDGIATSYVCSWQEEDRPYLGTALGTLVSELIRRLAYHDPSLQSLANHYILSDMNPGGIAQPNLWHSDILSKSVLAGLRKAKVDPERWSEWSFRF